MKRIKLTQGKFALVDDKDCRKIKAYKWFAHKRKSGGIYYARSSHKGKTLLMHRLIIDAPRGVLIDHRDGDGLNNTRSNLRLATNQENGWNWHCKPIGTSKYRGVSWVKRDKLWVAHITHNGKGIHVGGFKKEVDAARAYDNKVKELRGDNGTINGV